LLIADWEKNNQQPATSKQQMKRARARNEIIGRGDPVWSPIIWKIENQKFRIKQFTF